MNQIFNLFLVILFSYLVGAIPVSLIIVKFTKGVDIRNYGSGNIGGTNAIRILGWKLGVLVMLLDAMKGVIAVLFFATFLEITIFPEMSIKIIAGIFAIVGHVFSVFAKFKGGKGVATSAGILLSLVPIETLIVIGIFLIVFKISKYVSFGSIVAAVLFPFVMIIRKFFFDGNSIKGYDLLIYIVFSISFFIVFTHRKNILRLIHGTENTVSKIDIEEK